MAEDKAQPVVSTSARAEIDAILQKARSIASQRQAAAGRGRLLFALDATMSRQPTWDMACAIQADMFREAASAGGLDIQLIYYRGFGECRATPWVSDTR